MCQPARYGDRQAHLFASTVKCSSLNMSLIVNSNISTRRELKGGTLKASFIFFFKEMLELGKLASLPMRLLLPIVKRRGMLTRRSSFYETRVR